MNGARKNTPQSFVTTTLIRSTYYKSLWAIKVVTRLGAEQACPILQHSDSSIFEYNYTNLKCIKPLFLLYSRLIVLVELTFTLHNKFTVVATKFAINASFNATLEYTFNFWPVVYRSKASFKPFISPFVVLFIFINQYLLYALTSNKLI